MKNLPNIMTLSRIPCLFVIAGLVAWEAPWCNTIALAVFMFAALTDYLDGWLARRMGIVSNFGKLMDALTDKILNVGLFIFLLVFPVRDAATATADVAPLLPAWCSFLVVVILVRELLITGLRLVAASANMVLAAERSGKIKTVLQVFVITLLLFVHAARTDWGTPWYTSHAHQLAMWSFYAATLLTVASGAGYLIKYWRVFMGEPTPAAKP